MTGLGVRSARTVGRRRTVGGRRYLAALGMVTALAAAGCASSSGGAAPKDLPPLTLEKSPVALGELTTRGPQGQVPVWYTQVDLTPDQLAKVRAGKYKAAFLNTQSSPFMTSLQAGASAAFKAMNIKVVATTNSNLVAAQQAKDVQNVLPLKPNIILSLAVDPVAAAQYYQPAVRAGVKLVFLSNKPNGYRDGKEDVGIVTYDVAGLGKTTADEIGKYLNGNGKIGYVYYDANFWITNQREAAVLQELKDKWPGVNIVQKAGLADPNAAQKLVSAMITAHPDMKAIFMPWDSPTAEGATAALRAAHRTDVKIFTIDLGGTSALNMAQCGNVQEETSTLAYQFGYTAAIEGALGVLGASAPPLVVVPAFPVTAENLADGWKSTFLTDVPSDVASAAKTAHCPATLSGS
jgi:ribose transport system substrate-binding protein